MRMFFNNMRTFAADDSKKKLFQSIFFVRRIIDTIQMKTNIKCSSAATRNYFQSFVGSIKRWIRVKFPQVAINCKLFSVKFPWVCKFGIRAKWKKKLNRCIIPFASVPFNSLLFQRWNRGAQALSFVGIFAIIVNMLLEVTQWLLGAGSISPSTTTAKAIAPVWP